LIPVVIAIALLHVAVITAYYRLFAPEYRDLVKVRGVALCCRTCRLVSARVSCVPVVHISMRMNTAGTASSRAEVSAGRVVQAPLGAVGRVESRNARQGHSAVGIVAALRATVWRRDVASCAVTITSSADAFSPCDAACVPQSINQSINQCAVL
jgi:hypothetical protein